MCISQIKDEHLPAYGDPQNSLKLSGQTGAKVFSLLLTNTEIAQNALDMNSKTLTCERWN